MATFRVTSITDQQGGQPLVVPVVGSAKDEGVRPLVVAVAFGIVVVASIGAWALWKGVDPKDFVPRSDYTALALLVLFATALERLLEPFSRWLLPDNKENEEAAAAKKSAAETAADPTQPAATAKALADTAAAKNAVLARKKNERAIVHWAIATTLAFTGPALFGVFFLRVVSSEGASPNRFLDMVLTALIVGAGTKPLHDAIASIQAKKENTEDSASTA